MIDSAVGRTDEPTASEPPDAELGWRDFSLRSLQGHGGRGERRARRDLRRARGLGGRHRPLAAPAPSSGRSVLFFLRPARRRLGPAADRGPGPSWPRPAHQQELSRRPRGGGPGDRAGRGRRGASWRGLQALRGRYAAALTALHDMWLGYPAPYTGRGGADLPGRRRGRTATGWSSTAVPCRTRAPALPFLQGRLTTPTQLDAEARDARRRRDGDPVRGRPDRDPADRAHRDARPAALHVRLPPEHHRARPAGMRATGCPASGTCCAETGHDRLTWTPSPRCGRSGRDRR